MDDRTYIANDEECHHLLNKNEGEYKEKQKKLNKQLRKKKKHTLKINS